VSEDDLRWTLGARTPAHDYRVFRTAFVDGSHPRVGTKTFSLIESRDWVNVVALTDDARVVLVRQFRVGTGEVCLEIPGGMVDDGEDARAAAERELAEETGYTARAWRHLGTVCPNPALQGNRLHTFLATGAVRTGDQRLDSGEVLAVELRPLSEVQSAMRSGRIDHALVLVAFAHLALEQHVLHTPG
jgi:8-oxo-dGTP pyrophosphatase MutT (NUDIX family)